MKYRWIPLVLTLSLTLTGCGIFDGQYVRVTPRAVQSSKDKTQSITVSNYLDLRARLLEMVAAGTESGMVFAENYDYDTLVENMDMARRHILSYDPIGAYAVEDVAYEIGTNDGNTAVAVSIAYRHSLSDIRGIVQPKTEAALERVILQALENYEARKVLLLSENRKTDFTQLVQNLAQTHPQTVMECPTVSVGVYGLGSSQVVELNFTYENSRDALRQMQTQVQPVFDSASLYVSGDGSDQQKFSQLFSFLMDRFQYSIETSITPAYSLLRHGVGDSRAFATVYAAMCRDAGLECGIVVGTRAGEPWTWNIICDNGNYYHVDLIRCNSEGSFQEKTDFAMTGYVWDYSAYPACGGNIPPEDAPQK